MTTLAQKRVQFAGNVLNIFGQVQKLISPHQTHIFELVKYFREDLELFEYSFEQAYLKIFKAFHQRGNKKIPSKFETLTEQFFDNILPIQNDQREEPNALHLYNMFIGLCTEGIFSTIMNIRIMCSRLVFQVIKLVPPKKLQQFLTPITTQKVFQATLHLIKTKIPTYRQLGIKISSLVLHLPSNKQKILQSQLFKIMSTQDNQQIRKMVITNLNITKENLDTVLIRLRDKNPEIRSIVVKKLQGERFSLYDMTIDQIYRLLYDGYGSKELIVKRESVRYFSMFFTQQSGGLQVQNKHQEFVTLFRPHILLLNPHLYLLFNDLIGELLEEVEELMSGYIKIACTELKRNNLGSEIIWVKNSVTSQTRQIARVYEEYGPTGIQLANTLEELSRKGDIFCIHEILQLFACQKMPEQIGRNKMFSTLTNFLAFLPYLEVSPSYENFRDTDICHQIDEQQMQRKKLLLSYYDMPIISNSFDLIYQIGEAMKSLRPQHYEMQMREIMAEWYDPSENTKRKQKELIEANLRKLDKNDEKMQRVLSQKLKQIEKLLEQENEKTRRVLMCISRLSYNSNLEHYLPIIKEQLSKQNKANGLILLGLYCLENIEKVQTFWKVYWDILRSARENLDNNEKNQLLVSIKATTDFIVKFNSLSREDFHPLEIEDFNSDIFMSVMIKLILHQDAEVRILSIESLCRMIYHERVDESNLFSYFIYLVLLWLEVSTEEITSRSVHTVSIFMKSYIEKGNNWAKKLTEVFCIFFKLILKFQEEGKAINRSIIRYNLTTEQFLRKTISTALTVMKYQKQNKQVIWKYNLTESEVGPQQFLLIFLLTQQELTPLIGKSLAICDFFQLCSLETLILVKKIIQNINNTRKFKGVEQIFKRFQQDLQTHISLKNSETFNEPIVESLQRQNEEKIKLLVQETKRLHKNLQQQNLFIKIQSESEESEEEQDDQSRSESNMQESQGEDLSEKKRKKVTPMIDLEEEEMSSIKQSSYRSNLRSKRRHR